MTKINVKGLNVMERRIQLFLKRIAKKARFQIQIAKTKDEMSSELAASVKDQVTVFQLAQLTGTSMMLCE